MANDDCLFCRILEGEIPAGPLFPVLWSEDGYRDSDADYPRGFATTWSAERCSNINEYEEFKRQLAKQNA